MTRLLSRLLLAGLLLFAFAQAAFAAQAFMCVPPAAGTAPGPRQVTAASGAVYNLNNQGCALINGSTDIAFFRSRGYTPRAQIFALVASGITAAGSIGTLPGGTYIDRVVIQETSGAAVTGGVKLGTSSGGTQISSGNTCASSCLVWVPDASLSTRIFSSVTEVFVGSVGTFPTGGSTPSINVTIQYGYY